LLAANATCDGLADVLTNVIYLPTPNTQNTLTSWACKSIPTDGEDPAYYIYLRGRMNYETAIGNITCTVSPIQPGIFPVMYQSKTGVFSTKDQIKISEPAKIFSGSIEEALLGLTGVVWQSQTIQSNVMAESVIGLGVQSLRLLPYEKDKAYLALYAAMIQGILVNQV
jgi:hypothetical protein